MQTLFPQRKIGISFGCGDTIKIIVFLSNWKLKFQDICNTKKIWSEAIRIRNFWAPFSAVLGIRIRMFLGLPDPDQLFRGTDPDPSLFS